MSCDVSLPEPKISFQPHQQRLIDRITLRCSDQHGFLLCHSMGSGKTITSIGVLMNFPLNYQRIIITPKGLDQPWRNDFKKLGITETIYKGMEKEELQDITKAGTHYTFPLFLSYDDLLSLPMSTLNQFFKESIIVCDEAHNLLTYVFDRFRTPTETKSIGTLLQAFDSAFKVILLSGTPIQTKFVDLCKLINICAGKQVVPSISDDQFMLHYYPDEMMPKAAGMAKTVGLGLVNVFGFVKNVTNVATYYSSAAWNKLFKKNISELSKEQITTAFTDINTLSSVIQSSLSNSSNELSLSDRSHLEMLRDKVKVLGSEMFGVNVKEFLNNPSLTLLSSVIEKVVESSDDSTLAKSMDYIDVERFMKDAGSYISFFDYHNDSYENLKPYPEYDLDIQYVPFSDFQYSMMVKNYAGIDRSQRDIMVMKEVATDDYIGSTYMEGNEEQFVRKNKSLGNLSEELYHLTTRREKETNGNGTYHIRYIDQPDESIESKLTSHPFFEHQTSEHNESYHELESMYEKIMFKRVFSTAKFQTAFAELLHARMKYHYLPVVYSNFRENGYDLFSAFLNQLGLYHICIDPRDHPLERQRLVNYAKLPHRRYGFRYNEITTDPYFYDSTKQSFVRKTEHVIQPFPLDEEDERLNLNRSIHGFEGNVPFCILLHPDITEGISLNLSPVLVMLESAHGAGIQEQVYARILRNTSNRVPYVFETEKEKLTETFMKKTALLLKRVLDVVKQPYDIRSMTTKEQVESMIQFVQQQLKKVKDLSTIKAICEILDIEYSDKTVQQNKEDIQHFMDSIFTTRWEEAYQSFLLTPPETADECIQEGMCKTQKAKIKQVDHSYHQYEMNKYEYDSQEAKGSLQHHYHTLRNAADHVLNKTFHDDHDDTTVNDDTDDHQMNKNEQEEDEEDTYYKNHDQYTKVKTGFDDTLPSFTTFTLLDSKQRKEVQINESTKTNCHAKDVFLKNTKRELVGKSPVQLERRVYSKGGKTYMDFFVPSERQYKICKKRIVQLISGDIYSSIKSSTFNIDIPLQNLSFHVQERSFTPKAWTSIVEQMKISNHIQFVQRAGLQSTVMKQTPELIGSIFHETIQSSFSMTYVKQVCDQLFDTMHRLGEHKPKLLKIFFKKVSIHDNDTDREAWLQYIQSLLTSRYDVMLTLEEVGLINRFMEKIKTFPLEKIELVSKLVEQMTTEEVETYPGLYHIYEQFATEKEISAIPAPTNRAERRTFVESDFIQEFVYLRRLELLRVLWNDRMKNKEMCVMLMKTLVNKVFSLMETKRVQEWFSIFKSMPSIYIEPHQLMDSLHLGTEHKDAMDELRENEETRLLVQARFGKENEARLDAGFRVLKQTVSEFWETLNKKKYSLSYQRYMKEFKHKLSVTLSVDIQHFLRNTTQNETWTKVCGMLKQLKDHTISCSSDANVTVRNCPLWKPYESLSSTCNAIDMEKTLIHHKPMEDSRESMICVPHYADRNALQKSRVTGLITADCLYSSVYRWLVCSGLLDSFIKEYKLRVMTNHDAVCSSFMGKEKNMLVSEQNMVTVLKSAVASYFYDHADSFASLFESVKEKQVIERRFKTLVDVGSWNKSKIQMAIESQNRQFWPDDFEFSIVQSFIERNGSFRLVLGEGEQDRDISIQSISFPCGMSTKRFFIPL